MTNRVSPQVCPHSGRVGRKDQKLGPGPAAPSPGSLQGRELRQRGCCGEWGCRAWGWDICGGKRALYLQVQSGPPRARESGCPQSGQKEGLRNIQSFQEMDWATLRGGELLILGDVQSGDGGRCNGEVLRLWHQTDLDLHCNLGVSGQGTSPPLSLNFLICKVGP